MLSLAIFVILLYILLTIYKQQKEVIVSPVNIVEPNPVTVQIENHMKQDNDNVYIDNDILSGKLQLPEARDIDPKVLVSNEIQHVDISNQITLEDLQKAGGIAFPNDYTQFQKFDPKMLKYSVQPDNTYPALDMYQRTL